MVDDATTPGPRLPDDGYTPAEAYAFDAFWAALKDHPALAGIGVTFWTYRDGPETMADVTPEPDEADLPVVRAVVPRNISQRETESGHSVEMPVVLELFVAGFHDLDIWNLYGRVRFAAFDEPTRAAMRRQRGVVNGSPTGTTGIGPIGAAKHGLKTTTAIRITLYVRPTERPGSL